MANKSYVKGRSFENVVCRSLSQWLVDGDWRNATVYELPFRRQTTNSMPSTGHWEGKGDVIHMPGIDFPFAVEAKNREGWKFDGMFTCDKWPVLAWWKQAVAQADESGLLPILFFTRNRQPIYCAVSQEVAQCIKLSAQNLFLVLIFSSSSENENVVVTKLDDLVQVPRKHILKDLWKLISRR